MVDVSVDDLAQAGPAAGPVASLSTGLPFTESDAEIWIQQSCFKSGPAERVGIELEFVIHRDVDPPEHLDPDRLRRLHEDLRGQPLSCALTVEPGGQVELSSRPADRLCHAIADLEQDLGLLSGVAERHGARLVGVGLDPLPRPVRLLRLPRYDAMEAYFDRVGTAGRMMMRSSASVQVNVEAVGRSAVLDGPERRSDPERRSGLEQRWDLERRWDLLHAIGPVLAAVFGRPSSHPIDDPRLRGYRLPRQGIWRILDPERCRAPRRGIGESLQCAYARWVLDAPLLAVRRTDRPWTAPVGLTFRQWLRAGTRAVPDAGAPTLDDLEFHLSTMFPPVRARGHLEVRYVDAQPGPWWRVPAAVITTLTEDERAQETALEICEPVQDAWESAARNGLEDPLLRFAARRLMAVAAESSQAHHPELTVRVADYLDRVALPTTAVSSVDEEIPC